MSTAPHRAPGDRPNIILINCDDLGHGDLGCTGSTRNNTPYLDRMAAEGLRLSHFYAPSPICSPSRGAMLTGCYPPRIGFGHFSKGGVLFPADSHGLNPKETTLATLLKQQGYTTKLVGKWHCGDQPAFLPTRHGFDDYYGLPYSNDMGRQISPKIWYEPPPLPLMRNESVIQSQPDQSTLTERYTEECVRFIRDNATAPFFLYLAHMYVHLPIYPPSRFLRESRNGPYGAAVACIDWSTGVILHTLRTLGLDENTLVVFTSDNGSRARDEGGSNAPFRGVKGTTWEGGMRVPCLMRWPGQIPAGTTSDALSSAMDFLPTFAHLAGASPPADRILDGRDLGPLLRGEPGARSPHAGFFYYLGNNLHAVRNARWKLAVVEPNTQTGKAEDVCALYDLVEDPGETINQADTHPEIVAALRQQLEACREDLGDERTGFSGQNRRPAGIVAQPKPLTEYDPDYPYMQAEYDLPQRG